MSGAMPRVEEREVAMVADTAEAGFQVVENTLDWQFQIGPTINGNLDGVINSTRGYFYVSAPGPNITYVKLSLDNGGSWYSMPNNVNVSASGNADIIYTVQVPAGETIKFLIALN
ncbi:hypothetical protein [Sphingomonas sp. KR3-1]|uniref:hypothetical protein n=1 Tax=Sphingomonas sp. KR3-1 TaxID=3156611 RepID=UPI0032B4D50D